MDIILKKRKLIPAADYHFLRQEGLNYIENLSHDIWTDYNTHDPGITILEALCYALTELTYRSQFDMKDLLTDEQGSISNQPFFTPREILTSNPYSLPDYRKLLIDVKGVANAWLYPAQDIAIMPQWMQAYGQTEVPLYPDCGEDALTFDPTHHVHTDMRGLYHVRLDLDTTDDFGDLNNGNIDYTIYRGDISGAKIKCLLPRFNAVDFDWLSTYYSIAPANIKVDQKELDQFGNPLRWTVTLEYHNDEVIRLFSYDIEPAIKLPIPGFEALLEEQLILPVTQQEIIEMYFHKISLTRSIIQEVWDTLHANRNLCEDWWTIDTISNTPVAVCADLDVKPGADIEQVYARIMVMIEQYLNPPLRFYTLQEMLARNLSVEDIFEGPRLNNGFLPDEDVEKAAIKNELHVSELIEKIMKIEDVLAVKNVLLTAYDDNGKAMLPSQPWQLELTTDHKPVLDTERSKLTFFKNDVPYHINVAEAIDSILYLRGLSESNKINGTEQDIPLPAGRYFDLSSYSSLQHDLPETYGTTETGLPETADAPRRAQAKQLKAYLLFYDQLLAGFFAQLQHAKDLLGLDIESASTYYQQFLKDKLQDKETGIQNVLPLYVDADLLQKVMDGPLDSESATVTATRSKLLEDKEKLFDRRNRFLDHLIARFAETFDDYVLTRFASRSDAGEEELINDKIRFIKDYPESSRSRGTAYNITDTDNVSGLQKRVARLCGINNPEKRNLFPFPLPEITTTDDHFSFVIYDAFQTAYLQPITPLDTEQNAWLLLNEVYEHMSLTANYTIQEYDGDFSLLLKNDNGEVIATAPQTFPSVTNAEEFRTVILQTLARPADEETLHLIEHFLLRPYFIPPVMPPQTAEEVYRLMEVCLPENCGFCGEEDPYSFRMSVVLPFWPERFRDFGFRQFFENTLRQEAPAHVHVKVCWVSFLNMHRLETAHQEWLEALKNYRAFPIPDEAYNTAIREAGNKMIVTMEGLSSVFPEATLHDCAEGSTNPVLLGKTNLGSF